MKYEVNGRDDFEENSIDSDDLQITGITSNHVKVKNLELEQKIIFFVGDLYPPTPPPIYNFPDLWDELLPGQEKTVRMDGATQINFRKKVHYRTILRNEDQSLRLNDITATIRVDEVNLHA